VARAWRRRTSPARSRAAGRGGLVGRGRLTPDEVKALLVQTASPMTKVDGWWDFPCGTPVFVECGGDVNGTTGAAYAPWQVGAGAMNLGAALDALAGKTKKTKSRR
jgi:hypothetical protein